MTTDFWIELTRNDTIVLNHIVIVHRGLKLDGAIGQGEICKILEKIFFWLS